jgi:hypothetical protein
MHRSRIVIRTATEADVIVERTLAIPYASEFLRAVAELDAVQSCGTGPGRTAISDKFDSLARLHDAVFEGGMVSYLTDEDGCDFSTALAATRDLGALSTVASLEAVLTLFPKPVSAGRSSGTPCGRGKYPSPKGSGDGTG